jgi:uracil-DNA glycosylase
MLFMSGDPSSSPRRAAAQQLSSLRAAGVTRIGAGTRRSAGPGRGKNVTAAQPASAAAAPPPLAASLFQAQRSSMPRAEREQKLQILSEKVARCTRCAELAATRTQTVFGVGNPEARTMFIGEAPGADEDRLGEPFVGAAGQLLNRILEACHLKRSEVYICNILRCRPPGNRLPAPDEAAHCREYLDGQIEIVDPDFIVCLGSSAAKNLLGTPESIGKLRGRFFTYGRARVVCTYHPAYLLRNPAAKRDVWEDMKLLLRAMGVEL